MTFRITTVTIIVDPYATDFSNIQNQALSVNFAIDGFTVLENTVLERGKRQITLALTYDDTGGAQTDQYTVEIFNVGTDIADETDVVMADVGTVKNVALVPIANFNTNTDKASRKFAIITLSTSVADVNHYSSKKFTIDPTSPLSNQTPGTADLSFADAFLVSYGELVKTSSVNGGTKLASLVSITN